VTFTYRNGKLNFGFTAHAKSTRGSETSPARIGIGPVCVVHIERRRDKRVEGKVVVENRLDFFDDQPFSEILGEIESFLRIFEFPSRVMSTPVEEVIFPLERDCSRA
jgi:hypothetical protein